MAYEKGTMIAAFREKLEKLESETGCRFEIVYPKLDESLEANRLFADWFDQGCVLARAVKGKSVITYDVVGGLSAVLESPLGEVLESFKGKIVPVENELVYIESDKDLVELSSNGHSSGCSLKFEGHNVVRMQINDEKVGPIYAKASIAKAILNKDFIDELLGAVGETGATEAAEALEKAKETIESDSAETKEKAEKKPAKKGPKKAEGKTESQKGKTEPQEGVTRFDLLPLDVIGEFIEKFESYNDAKEGDFLKNIELFKKTGKGLVEAALSFAGACIDGQAADIVMKLADEATADAAENGEEALKMRPATSLINEAIKNYLMYLKANDSSAQNYGIKAIYALICASSVEER